MKNLGKRGYFFIICGQLTCNQTEKAENRIENPINWFCYSSGFGQTKIFGLVMVRNFLEPKLRLADFQLAENPVNRFHTPNLHWIFHIQYSLSSTLLKMIRGLKVR